MVNYMKADMYRLYKEKQLLISLILCIMLSVLMSYLMKNDNSSNGTVLTLSGISAFVPLFFVKVVAIMFGEDFSTRVINMKLIKTNTRLSLFTYKIIMVILLSLIYVLLTSISILCSRLVIVGTVDMSVIFTIFLYQIPYYLCSLLLCVFIFNYVDTTNQAYMIYIIIVLAFDNLAEYITSSILETNIFKNFLIFNQLKSVTGEGTWLSSSVIIALIFTVLYFVMSYYIFATREFK